MTMLAQPPVQCATPKIRSGMIPAQAIQTERFEAFNGVAAVEQFFEHAGAKNYQGN